MLGSNLLLLTYDSCRYDVLQAARTPVLDSFSPIHAAQSPGNFTYVAHLAFFAGILPNVSEDVPLYNRFNQQLFGLLEVGETNVSKNSLFPLHSHLNALYGFRQHGYQTVGAGAMNWFRQETLVHGFESFRFTNTDADAQIEYVLGTIDASRPFFAFINFGETHAPYTFRGQSEPCPVDVRARAMSWPPCETGPVGSDSPAFHHQAMAAEFLDSRLPKLLSRLPEDTVVVLCADHGDCFGEDGYWGHGINHPRVLEVPLSIFRLDGAPLDAR